jgi:hypothetical protein
MKAFFKKYLEKINEKSVLNRQGCMIWQGCIKKDQWAMVLLMPSFLMHSGTPCMFIDFYTWFTIKLCMLNQI